VVRVWEQGQETGEADALITNVPGLKVGIRTADCVPILLVDIALRAVGVVHAGWRGVVSGVAVSALNAMGEEFGSRAENLRAAIGPCIRLDSFEVGPEVATQFQELFPEREDLHSQTHVDLVEANRRQMVRWGMAEQSIHDSGLCTVRERDWFHSYRRDGGQSGRMVSYVGIRESGRI
jgi:hypothetical protein